WFADGLGVGSIVERLNRDSIPGPRGARWKCGALKRLLANERYTGRLIWGQRRFERRPGTHQKVPRTLPRSEWRISEQPDLRIVPQGLLDRVQARRVEVRGILPATGRTLMRGRNAAMFSPHLFSGFARCAVRGGAITAVRGGGGSSRYGCSWSWRNGRTTC